MRQSNAGGLPSLVVSSILAVALVAAAAPSRGQSCIQGKRTYDPTEVLVAPAGSGVIWYVDGAAGGDANDGRTPQTAFKTVARAIAGGAAPILPGDTVRIKAGRYRERTSVSKSGTAANRIVIGPYGNGEVVLDASNAVTGWTLVSGQIYRAHTGYAVTAVVVDDTALFPEFSQGALTAGRYYYDAAAGDLYLWAPGGGSPATHDVGVIRDDAYQDGFLVNQASHLTLYGLTVRFAGGHGVSVLGNDVRIEKCRLRFNGKAGVNLYGYGSIATSDAQIVKNDIYSNVMRNWPRGRYKFGGWAAGAVSNGTANVLYQGNVSHRNHGEGMLVYGGPGGDVFRDNVVYDNWSVNLYVDNHPNVVVERNFLYSSGPNPSDLYNNGDPDPSDQKNLRRLRPEGIMTADENYGNGSHLSNVLIANNVILNCRRGLTHYANAAGSGLKYVSVLNNTIVAPATLIPGEGPVAGIVIPYNGGNNVGSSYRNNLVYASQPSTYVLYSEDIPSQTEKFQGLSLGNNLWFHTARSAPFHWGASYSASYDYTQAQWLALSGTAHGAGDVYANPMLVNSQDFDAFTKRPLDASSPAVDHGTGVALSGDYGECPRPTGAQYEMGAFEVGSSSAGSKAEMLSPAPGSTLSSSTVAFSWTAGSGVSQYWLEIGTTPGGTELYSANQGTAVGVTLPGFPTDGRALYVRLRSLIGTSWQYNDYSYTAATVSVVLLSVSDVTVTEPRRGTVAAVFSVSLSKPASNTVTVSYATLSGTAVAPGDYAAASGTLSFAPGTKTLAINVWVNADTVAESSESFAVNLNASTNAAIADGQGIGTILNRRSHGGGGGK